MDNMPKYLKTLFIFSAALYCLILILVQTPAAWGAWFIHQVSPNVWLTGVSGTLWSGRAANAQMQIEQQSIPLGVFEWRIQPWSLLLLKPCTYFTSGIAQQSARGVVCSRLNGAIEGRDLQVEAPLATANAWLPIKVSGQASIQLRKVLIHQQQIKRLEGDISWSNASWNNSKTWVSLGAFAARLASPKNSDSGPTAEIFDLAGPLKIALNAELKPNREWVVSGEITPGPQAPSEIKQALEIAGEARENGAYYIAWP